MLVMSFSVKGLFLLVAMAMGVVMEVVRVMD